MTEGDLRAALDVLGAGGVVAAATETWFGFLADARNVSAIDRVYALKGRDANKGIALLLPARAAWASLVQDIPAPARALADRFWPGPLTVALPARDGVDVRLIVDGTVGVRWGAPSDASHLAAAFGAPLTATSANPSGTPPIATSEDIVATFAVPVAKGELFVVSGRAPGGAPSTVVVIRGEELWLAREGAIAKAALTAALPAGVKLQS